MSAIATPLRIPMGFHLTRGYGLGAEVRRLLVQQLGAAMHDLRGSAPDVRHARRHVKKARALLRLARPAIKHDFKSVERRLRKVNHLLGGLTDSAALARTLRWRSEVDRDWLPDSARDALEAVLAAHAAKTAPESPRVRRRVITMLTCLRDELARTSFSECGVHSTAAVIRAAHKRARTARRRVLEHPSHDTFHAWRRHTKVEWYLLRLVDEHVGGKLREAAGRLEQLDGTLGELHDIVVLQDFLLESSPLRRSETGRALRALRASAMQLKARARHLADALDESPSTMEARVLALWQIGVPLPAPLDDLRPLSRLA
jgi:CHAD domain-containing protein